MCEQALGVRAANSHASTKARRSAAWPYQSGSKGEGTKKTEHQEGEKGKAEQGPVKVGRCKVRKRIKEVPVESTGGLGGCSALISWGRAAHLSLTRVKKLQTQCNKVRVNGQQG
jgi:hypothetical protein